MKPNANKSTNSPGPRCPIDEAKIELIILSNRFCCFHSSSLIVSLRPFYNLRFILP